MKNELSNAGTIVEKIVILFEHIAEIPKAIKTSMSFSFDKAVKDGKKWAIAINDFLNILSYIKNNFKNIDPNEIAAGVAIFLNSFFEFLADIPKQISAILSAKDVNSITNPIAKIIYSVFNIIKGTIKGITGYFDFIEIPKKVKDIFSGIKVFFVGIFGNGGNMR